MDDLKVVYNMSCVVSVIVPVYNSQQFLLRCIESILVQTFTDFELILIDDGSTDKSGQICDEYAAKDHRIKVIHQGNAGAAAARNQGIFSAVGEYLMFCDSDDMVSSTWIEHLLQYAQNGVLPVGSYCSTCEELGKRTKLSGITEGKAVARSEYYHFSQVGIAGFLCNALYRKDIVINNHILCRVNREQGDFNEDLIFALSYIKNIKYLVYTGYSDYLYNVQATSLSHSYQQYYFEKYAEKYVLWSRFVLENLPLDSARLQKELATRFLYYVVAALQLKTNQWTFHFWKKRYNDFCQIVRSDIVRHCLNLADTSLENKFVIWAIRHRFSKLLWLFFNLVKFKIWL